MGRIVGTPSTGRALKAFHDLAATGNLNPTIREIQKQANLSSTSVAVYNINRLIDQGLVRKHPTIARGLQLMDLEPYEDGHRQLVALATAVVRGRIWERDTDTYKVPASCMEPLVIFLEGELCEATHRIAPSRCPSISSTG